MTDFYIDSANRQQVIRILQFKGEARTHTFDFGAWADDNAAVTTATWTVQSGQGTLSSKTLSSNVASAILTTSEADNGMITLSVTDGTRTKVVYIRYRVKDPQAVITSDYGLVSE